MGYCVEVCSGILCRGVYIVGYCVEVCSGILCRGV